jgi:hypothetical protein
VSVNELLISSLAMTDALAKLLIEKGLITREEFMQKTTEERATYQKLLNPTTQTSAKDFICEASKSPSSSRQKSPAKAIGNIIVIAAHY